MYHHFLKRFLDFTLSLTGFIILSPIFTVVALILCIANNGQAFFFQLRPGKNERIFKVIKFKTMNDKCDKDRNLLPDANELVFRMLFILFLTVKERGNR
jgi:lipopolysaccharide/colanic/teichoic acid biosynthesis glycosyltransferase